LALKGVGKSDKRGGRTVIARDWIGRRKFYFRKRRILLKQSLYGTPREWEKVFKSSVKMPMAVNCIAGQTRERGKEHSPLQ